MMSAQESHPDQELEFFYPILTGVMVQARKIDFVTKFARFAGLVAMLFVKA